MEIVVNGKTVEVAAGISMEQVTEAINAMGATKQDIITGTAGQVVGFDEQGQAVAQEAPQTGLSQEDADGRYLQLTGGTLTGALSINGAVLSFNRVANTLTIKGVG